MIGLRLFLVAVIMLDTRFDSFHAGLFVNP